MKLILLALLALSVASLTLRSHLYSSGWDAYAQTQLVATGQIQSGIIFSLADGSIWGSGGVPLNISSAEKAALVKFVKTKGASSPLTIGGVTY